MGCILLAHASRVVGRRFASQKKKAAAEADDTGVPTTRPTVGVEIENVSTPSARVFSAGAVFSAAAAAAHAARA